MTISVAIPCYEMLGRGVDMLSYSFSTLKKQTLKDFEVVVSDHSKDNNIAKLCKNEKQLNIKYIKNKKNYGSSSANINNAIKNCSNELIKILCQDDFLFGIEALNKTIKEFDYTKKWLTTSYIHTYDRINLFNHHIPKWNDKVYLENTIGTHSCLTILNDDPMLFDENLIWYMDCELYYRYWKKYGESIIIKEPTMCQMLWKGQVTNTIINQQIIDNEKLYILNMYERNNNE